LGKALPRRSVEQDPAKAQDPSLALAAAGSVDAVKDSLNVNLGMELSYNPDLAHDRSLGTAAKRKELILEAGFSELQSSLEHQSDAHGGSGANFTNWKLREISVEVLPEPVDKADRELVKAVQDMSEAGTGRIFGKK